MARKRTAGDGDSPDSLIVPPGSTPIPVPEVPPGGDGGPIRVGTIEEPEEEQEEVTEFSDEERQTFVSLLTVGHRIQEFSVMGHLVKMATPTVDDELRIAQFTKEWRETEGYAWSFRCAMVAAAIREIDGVPLYTDNLTAKPDPQIAFDARLEKVRGMYPLVVSLLHSKVQQMEQEFVDMARKLGKL